MKKITLFVFINFFFLNLSQAKAHHNVPNCWNNPDVKEGSYLIGIETNKISKEELLKVMDLADGKYLRAKNYPTIFEEYMVINTEAFDPGMEGRKLSKEELQKIVEHILASISHDSGISISCNVIVTPIER